MEVPQWLDVLFGGHFIKMDDLRVPSWIENSLQGLTMLKPFWDQPSCRGAPPRSTGWQLELKQIKVELESSTI